MNNGLRVAKRLWWKGNCKVNAITQAECFLKTYIATSSLTTHCICHRKCHLPKLAPCRIYRIECVQHDSFSKGWSMWEFSESGTMHPFRTLSFSLFIVIWLDIKIWYFQYERISSSRNTNKWTLSAWVSGDEVQLYMHPVLIASLGRGSWVHQFICLQFGLPCRVSQFSPPFNSTCSLMMSNRRYNHSETGDNHSGNKWLRPHFHFQLARVHYSEQFINGCMWSFRESLIKGPVWSRHHFLPIPKSIPIFFHTQTQQSKQCQTKVHM